MRRFVRVLQHCFVHLPEQRVLDCRRTPRILGIQEALPEEILEPAQLLHIPPIRKPKIMPCMPRLLHQNVPCHIVAAAASTTDAGGGGGGGGGGWIAGASLDPTHISC